MEQIAWIIDNVHIYWSTVILTLAAAGAIFLFLSLYLGNGGKAAAAAVFVPLALGLSLVLSRLVHWYCRPDAYHSLLSALDPGMPGGFALAGAFAGCLLAALAVRLIRLEKDLPMLLDCLCLAGGGGIAAGRLASFFNSSDRGMVVPTVISLPWACPVANPVSGIVENRIATFLLQAIAAGGITAILLVFFLTRKRQRKAGDVCLIFLMCYGASQVLLDSTRYDSLFFRSNGFVSVVQVAGALAMALGVIVFSLRLVRYGGWRRWYIGLWLAVAGCFGLAGYMEYYVQRHGSQAVFAYSVMGAALLDVLLLTLLIRFLGATARNRWENRLFGQ